MPQLMEVNIIFHDSQGRILLQRSDDVSETPEAGPWGFVGGMFEEGETIEIAISRCLIKELGYKTKFLATECFRTDHNTDVALNIGVFVACTHPDKISLISNNPRFCWFALDELIGLRLSPLVFRHISLLIKELSHLGTDIERRLEHRLMSQYSLTKKNDRVYYAKNRPSMMSMQGLMILKGLASHRGLPFCRVCLHQSDDEPIHEMLMIHTRPYKAGPLKQNKTSLSYHVLDGGVDVCLYDETGQMFWEEHFDSRNTFKPRSVRLEAKVFRSIESTTPYAIFLEVASGPFEDSDTFWL